MTTEDLLNLSQNHDWQSHKREIKTIIVLIFLLCFIAPYNTSSIPDIFWRILYWVMLVVFASSVSGPIARLVLPSLIDRRLPALPAFIIYTLVFAAAIFAAAFTLDIALSGVLINPDGLNWTYVWHRLSGSESGSTNLAILYIQVWILTASIAGVVTLIYDKLRQSDLQEPKLPAGYRFLKRLPAELGQDLLCLSMEDHYIRTYTEQGDTLILMRMADAVAELEDFAGLQVHRSWWVATSAIKSTSKAGRKHILHLNNGLQVPVSQPHLYKLKEQGFIR